MLQTVSNSILAALALIKIWGTDPMPGTATDKPEEVKAGHITHVSEPTLAFFQAESTAPAPAILICPGGGYNVLAYDKEGTEVAQWFARQGVHGAVLKYRVPGNREGAFADARQALKILKEKSTEWNIAPDKIGMMGFSAGAHLTVKTSTAAIADGGLKPAFQILVYPAYLSDNGIDIRPDVAPSKETPPTFITQPRNDNAFINSGSGYASALRRLGVPVEFHMFTTGGHGYGIRADRGRAATIWPHLAHGWLIEQGILK